MKENTANVGDYSLPFLMMVAKNMREHDFNNLDIGYILVSLFHASGQEAELVTDSSLENVDSIPDMNVGCDLFEGIAHHGSTADGQMHAYMNKLMTIFEEDEKEHK
ncbi:hypothetical protein [Lactobacillus sp.]|uniref:hypothetical protein n=1 Tax=Lactobacillus sp. TaxID=1591 RepID=UPI0019862275|nr:hypothetical protein [Lactobacillus sp.]MBD5429156.1 hypothetical protein [Lactobacillus sp.]